MAEAIDEYHGTIQSLGLDDLVARERPLVLRGLCRDWPMVAWAKQSDTAFAQGLAQWDSGSEVDALLMPATENGVVGYNAEFDGFNYAHHRISITQGLQRLAQYSRQENPPGLAIQSALVSACLPGLLGVHAVPFLDSTIQPRIWIGNKVTTPVHFDEYHNVACVACGVRRFTLFAPEQARNLYIGPLDFAPTGTAIGIARIDRPDDPRFPRLKRALAEALIADLWPGDAIYIPPMWWHHVVSLQQINALVNYWWRPASSNALVPNSSLGCLMHCILTFRSLPPAERVAWKNLLDYYVFGDEDPVAHLPMGRRGILGELTAEQLTAFRAVIRRYL